MLSVIVPAYNEEKVIGETVAIVSRYLVEKFPDSELIIVSDGSRDRTFEIAKAYASDHVKVFEYHPNRGKGGALKFGFEQSRGDLVVFYDAGLNFPPEEIGEFLSVLEAQGVDVVVGSKRHRDSEVAYPFKRRIVSFMAQLMVRTLFSLRVTDTQVGLKAFRREVLAKVMPRVLVKRYALDIELLALAQHFGYKIAEAPVKINLKFSTAASLNSIWKCYVDTLAVFYRLRWIKFYDKSEAERELMIKNYQITPWERLISKFSRVIGKK